MHCDQSVFPEWHIYTMLCTVCVVSVTVFFRHLATGWEQQEQYLVFEEICEKILLQLLGKTRLKQNALTQHVQCSELSAVHPIPLLSKHWEKESSSVTRGPSRHTALQLSELASSWADSICLTFSVGHAEPWAGNKVLGLGPHWSENSASDCWPTLKYLVLITATTFTLAGYCWNIIPKGLRSKGITPLFSIEGMAAIPLPRHFLSGKWGTSTADYIGCFWQKSNKKSWDESLHNP